MKSRLIVSVALVMAPMIAPFAACSDTSGSAPDGPDGGDDAGRREASHDDYFVPPDEHDSGPVFNADGWIQLDFPACALYAAPSADKMPPPIEWEACDPAFLAQGWACRKVKYTWAPPSNPGLQMMGPAVDGWVDENGHAWIDFTPYSGDHGYHFVVEVDGRVHTAVSQPQPPTACGIINAKLSGHKVLFHAQRETMTSTGGRQLEHVGALGGPVDEVPHLLEVYDDGLPRGYYAGPNAYMALANMQLRPWTQGPAPITIDENDPGQSRFFNFVGDTTFFTVGNLSYHRIKEFSPTSGLRDFVSFGNDINAGAADFGTDGVDMVWSEASGSRTSDMDRWTTINIMKAPYTSDPASIQKTRVRSEPYSFGANPFIVGCGYAVHDFSTDTETGARLVRLSDGRSWRFTRLTNIDGGTAAIFTAALAITCDELFINYNGNYPEFQVARIRLDSLGPGDPPD